MSAPSELGSVNAKHLNRTRSWKRQPGSERQHCRLSRSGGPDKRDALTGPDREGEVLDCWTVTGWIPNRDIAEPQQVISRRSLRCRDPRLRCRCSCH